MLERGSSSYRFPSCQAPVFYISCKNGIHAINFTDQETKTGNQEEKRPAGELEPTQPGTQGLGVSRHQDLALSHLLPDLRGKSQSFYPICSRGFPLWRGCQVSLTLSASIACSGIKLHPLDLWFIQNSRDEACSSLSAGHWAGLTPLESIIELDAQVPV